MDDKAKQAIKLQIETDNPALEIFNPNHDAYPINISHALANLLGTSTQLGAKTYVKKLYTMSAQNVLPPSAPPEQIYPDLPSI